MFENVARLALLQKYIYSSLKYSRIYIATNLYFLSQKIADRGTNTFHDGFLELLAFYHRSWLNHITPTERRLDGCLSMRTCLGCRLQFGHLPLFNPPTFGAFSIVGQDLVQTGLVVTSFASLTLSHISGLKGKQNVLGTAAFTEMASHMTVLAL